MTAPNVTTNQFGQRETQIGGKTYNVYTGTRGEDYVMIDGKPVNLSDPIFNYSCNVTQIWKNLNKSFDEQIENHQGWLERWKNKFKLENVKYWTAVEDYKTNSKQYNNYMSSVGVKTFNELDAAQKKEVQIYITGKSVAGRTKRSAESKSLSYGLMVTSESNALLACSNMQELAERQFKNRFGV